MKQRKIEFHIDEIVLHGFPSGDRHRIGGAIEQELIRLVREQRWATLSPTGEEHERLNGGAFNVVPGSKPETTGAQIAQAVYSGLAPHKRR